MVAEVAACRVSYEVELSDPFSGRSVFVARGLGAEVLGEGGVGDFGGWHGFLDGGLDWIRL